MMMPNGTLKTLIPSDGVLNWDGVSKSSGKPEALEEKHVFFTSLCD
jgi:hypothetical protein